jgi:hypothetical protein
MADTTSSSLIASMTTTSSAVTAATEANAHDLQDTVSRLASHPGVQAVLILTREGDIVAAHPSPPESTSSEEANEAPTSPIPPYARAVQSLLRVAQAHVHSLDPDDQVTFLHWRTQRHRECLIAPHHGYVLAVLKE